MNYDKIKIIQNEEETKHRGTYKKGGKYVLMNSKFFTFIFHITVVSSEVQKSKK